MPTPATPARSYHHGNLRRALVDAGVELATAGGPGAVLLREAARRVGVSHNAGYRHFASRDELLSAVADEGQTRLAEAMNAALATAPPVAARGRRTDPGRAARARLRAIGRAYVTFALAEPGLFRTAFAIGVLPSEAPAVAGADPYQILNGVLDEFVAAGLLPVRRRAHSEIVAWSAVHGLATLALDGPLRALPADQLDAALDRLCAVVDAGLATTG